MTVADKGSNAFVLDGGESLPDLTGIEIDLKGNLVRTPQGIAKNRVDIHADDKSVLGPWNGVQWQSDTDDVSVFTKGTVKLAVGTHEPSGRAVLYYTVKKVGLG